jgi:hypothetical protein
MMKLKPLFACILIVLGATQNFSYSGERDGSIEISESHRVCEVDNDCAAIQLHCGGCDCGHAVNRAYLSLYQSKREAHCKNYSGPWCDMYCGEAKLVCVNKRCGIHYLEGNS